MIGLTAAGAPDDAFGTAASRRSNLRPGEPVYCESIAAQDDGRLLVAGNAAGVTVTRRGCSQMARAIPPSRRMPPSPSSMNDATSIAVGGDGRILVAGSGLKGASIMRLQATGQLDPGSATAAAPGSTFIRCRRRIARARHGGASRWQRDRRRRRLIAAIGAFAVRLLGDAGGDSPGVLSLSSTYVASDEVDGQAIVHVRRSGGSAGDVSIGYRRWRMAQAMSGEDFTAASGTLHWADGDASEREIQVGIAADEGPAGGLSSHSASRSPTPAAAPGLARKTRPLISSRTAHRPGRSTLDDADDVAYEGGVAYVWVSRNFYAGRRGVGDSHGQRASGRRPETILMRTR